MTSDELSLVLRFVILALLGLSSEVALRVKKYSISFFLLTIWVTVFRLVSYRAVASYAGIFKHETQYNQNIKDLLLSSQVSNITDTLMLFGVVVLFIWIVKKYRKFLKVV